MTDQQWDALAGQRDYPVLDPAGLRHLYQDQHLAIKEIARLSLTTERVVRRALTDAGVTLLSRRPRTKAVPAEWFHQHYLNTDKTVRQAATDAGISPTTFRKYAREHNIPTGPNAPLANPFAAWPPEQQPPPNVVAVCAQPRGIDYLREVLHMPGHPTRRAAAVALGLHEQVLCNHRQHVEQAAGIRIFQPEQTPLTLTPEGGLFIHHATSALELLDTRPS